MRTTAISSSSILAFFLSRAVCAATLFLSFLLKVLSSALKFSSLLRFLPPCENPNSSSSKDARTFLASTVEIWRRFMVVISVET